MARYVRSYMTSKNIRFTVQINSYSTYVCKGFYASPEFGIDESESNWSLLISAYDGADYENFISVRLKRENHVAEEQFVDVKISVINSLGFKGFEKKTEVLFDDGNVKQILAIAKEDVTGYCGMKRFFYLPNDTLTLQCDLIVRENSISSFENRENFVNNRSNPVPPITTDSVECFAHSRIVTKAKDHFIRDIRDFTVHTYSGRYISPEYESRYFDGKWSLVVYKATGEFSTEFIDIGLKRAESYEHQLMKAKLSVVDSSGKILLSNEEYVYFTGSEEVRLLSHTQKTSKWFRLNKNYLVPEDALTLQCEMVLLEQEDYSFDEKRDFERSVRNYGFTPRALMPYLGLAFFLSLVVAHAFLKCMFHLVWLMIPSVWQFISYAAIITVCIVIIAVALNYIENKGKKIVARKKKRKAARERMQTMLVDLKENGLMSDYAILVPRKKSNYNGYQNHRYLTYDQDQNHGNRKYLKN